MATKLSVILIFSPVQRSCNSTFSSRSLGRGVRSTISHDTAPQMERRGGKEEGAEVLIPEHEPNSRRVRKLYSSAALGQPKRNPKRGLSHLECQKTTHKEAKWVPNRAPEATRAQNDEKLIFADGTLHCFLQWFLRSRGLSGEVNIDRKRLLNRIIGQKAS